MLNINLKHHVTAAINADWAGFAMAHPNLARVIDRDLLIEQAAASIAEAPEYRQAMEDVARAGAPAALLAELIARLARRWLLRLI
jgi:hypothetical protein